MRQKRLAVLSYYVGWDSLLPLLGALGCKLLLVDDPEARRRKAQRKVWRRRQESQARVAIIKDRRDQSKSLKLG
jgi:hypothetical protein